MKNVIMVFRAPDGSAHDIEGDAATLAHINNQLIELDLFKRSRFTREQQGLIAAAMREARPFILDSPEAMAKKSNAWLAARGMYENACTSLCDMLQRNVQGFDSEERRIFLSNCRAIEIKPFVCTVCGEHIKDGKPCGHGRRAELGIV